MLPLSFLLCRRSWSCDWEIKKYKNWKWRTKARFLWHGGRCITFHMFCYIICNNKLGFIAICYKLHHVWRNTSLVITCYETGTFITIDICVHFLEDASAFDREFKEKTRNFARHRELGGTNVSVIKNISRLTKGKDLDFCFVFNSC